MDEKLHIVHPQETSLGENRSHPSKPQQPLQLASITPHRLTCSTPQIRTCPTTATIARTNARQRRRWKITYLAKDKHWQDGKKGTGQPTQHPTLTANQRRKGQNPPNGPCKRAATIRNQRHANRTNHPHGRTQHPAGNQRPTHAPWPPGGCNNATDPGQVTTAPWQMGTGEQRLTPSQRHCRHPRGQCRC